jgi:DNA gyrase subunit B
VTATRDSYQAKDITVLEGLEAVRRRPGMYIGSTGPRGLHHLIWEVVDNSVDEAMAGYCSKISVTLRADGGVEVTDDGRGIPVDRMEKTKRSALTTILTTLHSGGKFEQGAYTVSGGLHGVGISVVNALSTRLEAEVRREGNLYTQEFRVGQPKTKDPKKERPFKKTGTTIRFWPDPDIFSETTEFDYDIVASRLRETAFLNRGLQITLTDERGEEPREESFYYKGGSDRLRQPPQLEARSAPPHIVDISDVSEDAEIELAMQWTNTYTESILTFANNINTHEGGTHEEGFRKALTKAINDFARPRTSSRKRTPTSPVRTSARVSPPWSRFESRSPSSRVRPRPSWATPRFAPTWRRPSTASSRSGWRSTPRRRGASSTSASTLPRPAMPPARPAN